MEAELELAEAARELEMACAVRERALAIRESELKRNKQLLEAGGEPGQVSPKPDPVPEALAQRVEKARLAVQRLKSEVDESPVSPRPERVLPDQPGGLPSRSEVLSAGALVALLSVVVVNLPIVIYGLLFDRIPNLLSGVFYFALFLALGVGAARLCQRLLPVRISQSVEIVFGLQVMLCTLPGIFIGAGLASPYLKTTVQPPVKVASPQQKTPSTWLGYYEFDSARIWGALAASEIKTRRTRSGDAVTVSKKTYSVAPLVEAGTPNPASGRIWVVLEGSRFTSQDIERTPFLGLVTRSTSTLEAAVAKSQRKHDYELAGEIIFLKEITPEDRAWYGKYLALSLGVLNVLVLGLIGFAVLRGSR